MRGYSGIPPSFRLHSDRIALASTIMASAWDGSAGRGRFVARPNKFARVAPRVAYIGGDASMRAAPVYAPPGRLVYRRGRPYQSWPYTVSSAGAVARGAAAQIPVSLAAIRQHFGGLTKETSTVAAYAAAAITTTTVGCITSSTTVATAVSSSGLISVAADSAQLNFLLLRGFVTVAESTAQTFGVVRLLVVNYIRPATQPSAAGTLPLVTDCLESDSVYSLPLSDAANSGRFRILHDSTFNVGRNAYPTTTGVDTSVFGLQTVNINRVVRLGVQQHYVISPSVSTNALGGHFDSDVSGGLVNRNLVCLYVLTAGNVSMTMTLNRRVHYTG